MTCMAKPRSTTPHYPSLRHTAQRNFSRPRSLRVVRHLHLSPENAANSTEFLGWLYLSPSEFIDVRARGLFNDALVPVCATGGPLLRRCLPARAASPRYTGTPHQSPGSAPVRTPPPALSSQALSRGCGSRQGPVRLERSPLPPPGWLSRLRSHHRYRAAIQTEQRLQPHHSLRSRRL